MKVDMYVRCPIDIENPNAPRIFALGQIAKINDVAATAEVILRDPFKYRKYYDFIPNSVNLPVKHLKRCCALPNSMVHLKAGGYAKLLCKASKREEEEIYYSYYVLKHDGTVECLEECGIEVPFTQIDYSPLKQLATYELHNPTFFKNRAIVSGSMHVLRNAIYGFEVLAGCRVFLMPHQISTISRCLEDYPIRYMLADEVGLGKTIEACAIFKIAQSQNRNIRALLILPNSLIDQWRTELLYKFNIESNILDKDCSKPGVYITSMESLGQTSGEEYLGFAWDFCIVDETHRLLLTPIQYNIVRDLSRKSTNLLLLSATPVQERKAEFLSLLRLLNPQQYEVMSADQFDFLLDKQRKIQRKVYLLLGEFEEYDDSPEDVLESLQGISDEINDPILKDLIMSVNMSSTDKGFSQVSVAVAYLCEHYRIERRIIRNRREILRETLPERKQIIISYEMSGSDVLYFESNVYEALIEWFEQSNINRDFILKVAQPLLSAFFSSPWAFLNELRQHEIKNDSLITIAERWRQATEAEYRNWQNALSYPETIKGRLLRVLDYIDQETVEQESGAIKLVVFTRYKPTLDAFAKLIQEKMGKEAFAVFCQGMRQHDLQESVDRFQTDPLCRIMICDELGGEGRNFQQADQLIHIDVPWRANELEQRIGRLDRIGREKNRDVLSVVFVSEGTIEEQLLRLWNKGLQIFEKSLSGLEIGLAKINDDIVSAMESNIRYGLGDAVEQIMETSRQMREWVTEEQHFDAAAVIYQPLRLQLERMVKQYQKCENDLFASAMMAWASQAGLNGQGRREGVSWTVTFDERSFSVNSAKNTFLIPPDWTIYENYPMSHRNQQIKGTFDRALSILREDLLFFAPGDPAFEAIVNNALACGRGRACAYAELADYYYKGLILVWSVEPNVEPLLEIGADIRSLTLFRGFLPLEQVYTSFPLDDKSAEVPINLIRKTILEKIHNKDKCAHLGQRNTHKDFLDYKNRYGKTNLEAFRTAFPREKWFDILKTAQKRCREEAIRIVRSQSDLQQARTEARRIVDSVSATDLYYGRPASDNGRLREVFDAVIEGLEKPIIALDAASFVWMVKKDD